MIERACPQLSSAPEDPGAASSGLAGRGALPATLVVLALLLPSRASAQTSCTQTKFPTSPSLCSLTSAWVVEVADVNGDGKLDLIAIDFSGNVSLLLGDGAGNFTCPGAPIPGPGTPDDATVGDFNGDGKADLAVVSEQKLGVFLGGAAGFTPYVLYPLTDFSKSVAAADFNRDGKLDLVVTSSLIEPFRGNGDGSFTAQTPLTPTFFSDVVRTGDFNSDGYPDLALANSNKNEVEVSLGNGDGTFGSPLITATPGSGQPTHIVAGDFNGDAIPDVAVTKTGSTDVAVLLGDGTGRFPSGQSWTIGGGISRDLAVGDLNGDGLDDLVLGSDAGLFASVNATGAECIRFLSATSTGTAASGQDLLQWLNPPTAYSAVRVTWNTAATLAGCTAPADPTTVPVPQRIDLAYGTPGAAQTFAHAGLTPNTAYCYAVFVNTGGTPPYSGSREVKARPFDSTGAVKWAYSTGASSTAAPGNGVGAVHAVANNGQLHSMVKGASGGTWPSSWKPKAMAGPSQGRPSTVGVTMKGVTRVVFLGSQDGLVYAVGADAGQQLWQSPYLGVGVQAAPSGIFTIFGGNHDYILVGTRNSTVNNVFYALNVNNGNIVWQYDGTANGKQIGMINAQASVDYASRRVYFTSYGRAPNNQAVWCLDLDTGGLVWAAGFGSDVPGSPIFRGNHVYVGGLDGTVRALRTSDGGVDWTYTPAGGPDGVVKAFVFPDRLGTRLFFSTTNTVWAIQDNGGTALLVWSRNDLQSPSTPVFIPGGPHLYVGTGGAGNGKLYRLSDAAGSTVDSFPLGDLAAQIGSPTLDLSAGFLYVGSDAGVVYAIQLP